MFCFVTKVNVGLGDDKSREVISFSNAGYNSASVGANTE